MKKYLITGFSGVVFGVGLAISGMTKPEVVLSFLQLRDLGLLFVLFPAAIIMALAIYFLKGKRAPATNVKRGKRDYKLGGHTVLGGVFFGLGWGISGICPGAAFASVGIGNYPILVAIITMALGSWLYFLFAKHFPQSHFVKDREE